MVVNFIGSVSLLEKFFSFGGLASFAHPDCLKISKSFRGTMVAAVAASVFAMVVGIFTSFGLNLPPSGMIVMTLFFLYFFASLKSLAGWVRRI